MFPERSGDLLADLDVNLQRALALKDQLAVALRTFNEQPDVQTREAVLTIATELEQAHLWLLGDGSGLPGASMVASLVEVTLDRAQREADHDIYLRDPAGPAKVHLDRLMDAIESLDAAAENVRQNLDSPENLQLLEQALVSVTGIKQELVGAQRRTWRTSAVDHNVERAEDRVSDGRALVRQVQALRHPRVKRQTREMLEVLVMYGR